MGVRHNVFTLIDKFMNFNVSSSSAPQSLAFPSSGLMGGEGTVPHVLHLPPHPGQQ